MAAGVWTFRSPTQDSIAERRSSGQRLSTGLVALSSGAILAVYAAGYHRTGSAADRFAEQTARRRMAGPIAASAFAPSAAPYRVEPTPTVPPPSTPSAPPIAKTKRATTHGTAVPQVAEPNDDRKLNPSAPPLSVPHTNTPIEAVVLPTPVATNNAVAELSPPPEVKSQIQYKDGTYLGWGSCRHGDIQASVEIQGGKIASTSIAQCLTRYSCSWISNLPGQVVTRQSPEVDYVSGATQSTDAFYGAVVDALSKARE